MRAFTAIVVLGLGAAVAAPGTASAEDCSLLTPSRHVIAVEAKNDEWAGSGVTVEAGDLLFITASGTIKLSGSKSAKPGQKWTSNGRVEYQNGALELKIGTTFRTFTDEKYSAESPVAGELKLRVKDS